MPEQKRRVARGRGVAFALLAGGSLLGLLLAGQPWWTIPGSTGHTGLTGNEASSTLTGVLAGSAAAGTALAALSGRLARTILGVLLTLLGLGMVLVGLRTRGAAAVPAGLDATTLAEPERVPGIALAYLAGGVAVAVGGAVLAARARTWPQRPDRFARDRARAGVTAADDAAEVWKAMDAGHDPTCAPRIDEPTDLPDAGDTSGQNRPNRRE